MEKGNWLQQNELQKKIKKMSMLLKTKRAIEHALKDFEDISYRDKENWFEFSYVDDEKLKTLFVLDRKSK